MSRELERPLVTFDCPFCKWRAYFAYEITTTSGRMLYVGHAVPQVDGGVRYLCAETEREARDLAETIRRDPAMIDYVRCIPVDGGR